MEFKGTFQLQLINRETAIKARHVARKELRGVFLACCLAYVVEIGRQIPVLTGASRAAFAARANELIGLITKYSPSLLQLIDIDVAADLALTKTLAKQEAHTIPSIGTTPRRDKWAASLRKGGQVPGVFSSDEYLPMLLDVGTLAQLSPNFTFNIAIEGDWYLQYYDAGTINEHVGDWSLEGTQKYWGHYEVGPWDLTEDGTKAFRRMYRRLAQKVKLSPVYTRSLTLE